MTILYAGVSSLQLLPVTMPSLSSLACNMATFAAAATVPLLVAAGVVVVAAGGGDFKSHGANSSLVQHCHRYGIMGVRFELFFWVRLCRMQVCSFSTCQVLMFFFGVLCIYIPYYNPYIATL